MDQGLSLRPGHLVEDLRPVLLSSLSALAPPVRGLRVLIFGGSSRGFPGGDGIAEALEALPGLGLEVSYTHEIDPDIHETLSREYDLVIVCMTRVANIAALPPRIWKCARTRVLWFWDLRPAVRVACLRGRFDWAFLSFRGAWVAPSGEAHDAGLWPLELDCRVGYCPQAGPLREPNRLEPRAPRVLFVGDLNNPTYHSDRNLLCNALRATVVNQRVRAHRIAVERSLPTAYATARYCLSVSPPAPAYTSVRTYTILACGGMMLIRRFPECERLFRDGEHAIVFDGYRDLVPRLAELDQDEETRDAIAAAGRRLHAEKHTVAHRVLSICRQVTGVDSDFSGWLS